MSKRVLLLTVALLLALPACARSRGKAAHFDGKTWWQYVKVLADDKMEGRETGSEGLRKAEAYVVEQLKLAGLKPAGSNGYYQPVKFVSRQLVEPESSAALVRQGIEEPLKLGEDGVLSTRANLAPEVTAPLVFVGYGLRIPEKNYDDLAGLDLKGKVAVVLSGMPADLPAELGSHYESPSERWKGLRQAGAIGVINIMNPAAMDIPWARLTLNRTRPNMKLADPRFDETSGTKLGMFFNPAKAEKLFAGSGHTFSELVALANERKRLPRFPLPVSIKTRAKVLTRELESNNIVAELPGTDPELKRQYVVLTAHIDHLGVGAPINGDRVYHGAMDNASGCAVLLDVAASLRHDSAKLRRSLLFVFVTGEEKGLLGSKYFAANPTVEPRSMVANINIDMFLPIVPLKVLTVLGLQESDLGDSARQAAQSLGIAVQPDPEPLRNTFIRSDQYSFIRHGIPALAMDIGAAADSGQAKVFQEWRTRRYHAPADDVHQPVDLSAAADYEEVVRELLISVADQDRPPQWKPDSFFRRFAEAPAQ